MTTLKDVVGDYEAFLDRIQKELVDEGFDLDDFVQMDHMCYRTSTLEAYETKTQAMAAVARPLGEVQVNGRPIATFRLFVPVRFGRWRIDAVEIPAPKDNSSYQDGLEHVELVIYDDIDDFLNKYTGKNFDSKAADRGVNPEIGYKLPSYGVKFHLLNLPAVAYLEKKFMSGDVHDGTRLNIQ